MTLANPAMPDLHKQHLTASHHVLRTRVRPHERAPTTQHRTLAASLHQQQLLLLLLGQTPCRLLLLLLLLGHTHCLLLLLLLH